MIVYGKCQKCSRHMDYCICKRNKVEPEGITNELNDDQKQQLYDMLDEVGNDSVIDEMVRHSAKKLPHLKGYQAVRAVVLKQNRYHEPLERRTDMTEKLTTPPAVEFKFDTNWDIDEHGGSISHTEVKLVFEGTETEIGHIECTGFASVLNNDCEEGDGCLERAICDIVGDDDQDFIDHYAKLAREAATAHLSAEHKVSIGWESNFTDQC